MPASKTSKVVILPWGVRRKPWPTLFVSISYPATTPRSLIASYWPHEVYDCVWPQAARAWAYEQGVASLISLIHPDNVRSIRVAEKLDAAPTDTIQAGGKPAVIWRHPQQLS